MDQHDGFIVGIYDYCDRWCERCRFTGWCRVFADGAKDDAARDPALAPVVRAPLLAEERPSEAPRWARELIDEMNRAADEAISGRKLRLLEPKPVPEHERIAERATQYAVRVHSLLHSTGRVASTRQEDPVVVLGHFHLLIPAKVRRALDGLACEAPEERSRPADHDGSAKVALLAMEESHAACLRLLERDPRHAAEIHLLTADLVWLADELDRMFPKARAFVRPAFDEPDEVARLLAGEGWR